MFFANVYIWLLSTICRWIIFKYEFFSNISSSVLHVQRQFPLGSWLTKQMDRIKLSINICSTSSHEEQDATVKLKQRHDRHDGRPAAFDSADRPRRLEQLSCAKKGLRLFIWLHDCRSFWLLEWQVNQKQDIERQNDRLDKNRKNIFLWFICQIQPPPWQTAYQILPRRANN